MSRYRLVAIVLCFTLLNLTACQARRTRHRQRNREISKTKDGVNLVASKTESPTTESVQYDSIYGEWSAWGRCTRRCKEVRWRPCVSTEACGDNILREERHCIGGRCPNVGGTNGPIIIPNTGTVIQKGRSNTDVQSLYKMREMVYSVWSEWTPCNRNCRTKRRRVCEVEYLCGDSVVEENYICIDKIGGTCDKLHREKKLTASDMLTHYFNVFGAEIEESTTSVDSVDKENPLEKYESQCGISAVPDTEMALRIIGGRETVKGRWPWQVIILNRHKEPFCGGTIIAPNWIVTAAHCVRKRLYIRAGEHDLVEKEGTEQEIRVEESVLHPDYDSETVDNDMALLKLRSPLIFNDNVKPACLPQPEENLPLQARAHILGWGKRRNTALYGTDVLHEAEVPVVDLEDCKEVYLDYHISQNMLCAGYKRGRVDSCAGDSGGPLLYRNDKRWAIYGVTSFGEGCGRKGKYGIYAKVSNFIGWIRRTIASKLV